MDWLKALGRAREYRAPEPYDVSGASPFVQVVEPTPNARPILNDTWLSTLPRAPEAMQADMPAPRAIPVQGGSPALAALPQMATMPEARTITRDLPRPEMDEERAPARGSALRPQYSLAELEMVRKIQGMGPKATPVAELAGQQLFGYAMSMQKQIDAQSDPREKAKLEQMRINRLEQLFGKDAMKNARLWGYQPD